MGNRNGPKMESLIELYGESVAEICDKIWEIAQKYVLREIVIRNGSHEWHEKEHPTREDADKFLAIQAKSTRRVYVPSDLTIDLLRNFRGKQINIFIHIYSDTISNQAVFREVERSLLTPQETNRARAETTQELVELAEQLKDMHSYHLHGNQCAWLAWANAIHSKEDSLVNRDELLRDTVPPAAVVHLFRSVPVSEASRLHSLRHGLTVARSVSEGFKIDIKDIRQWVDTFRTTVTLAIEMISTRLDSIEGRVNSNYQLLTEAATAAAPVENAISLDLANRVDDIDDLDHQ